MRRPEHPWCHPETPDRPAGMTPSSSAKSPPAAAHPQRAAGCLGWAAEPAWRSHSRAATSSGERNGGNAQAAMAKQCRYSEREREREDFMPRGGEGWDEFQELISELFCTVMMKNRKSGNWQEKNFVKKITWTRRNGLAGGFAKEKPAKMRLKWMEWTFCPGNTRRYQIGMRNRVSIRLYQIRLLAPARSRPREQIECPAPSFWVWLGLVGLNSVELAIPTP